MEITCNPREFEFALGELFKRMGFVGVEVTKASGDGGVDLHALNPAPIVGGRYIVQAKRYQGTVGEPEVRDLYGTLLHERAMKAILITSGNFSKPAMIWAEGKHIELIDGEALKAMIDRYGLHREFGIETNSKTVIDTPSLPHPSLPAVNTEPASIHPPKYVSTLLALTLFCIAVGCLYSTYQRSKQGSDSKSVQPQVKPQQTPSPTPEIKAPQPPPVPAAASKPTPTPITPPSMTETPAPALTNVLVEPKASPDATRRALQIYPELGVANSPFNRVFVLRYQRYQTQNPDFFDDPEWPTKLADEVAKIAGGALRQPLQSVRRPSR